MNLSRLIGRLLPKGRTPHYLVYTGGSIVAWIIIMSLIAPLLTEYDPTVPVANPLQPPSPKHPLGTNNLGYDMYSRLLYGGRTVLYIVLLSTLISMVAGVILGLVSGYYGGLKDRILTLIMDSVYSFPDVILAIAISIALGPGIYNAAIAIAVVYIPTYFRMVRGQALVLREQGYVTAARMLGAKDWWIMSRYILPNLLPVVVVVFTLNVTDAILTEAALSFLGLGVVPPTPDWGYDLRAGQTYLPAGYWWLVTFPGLMIMLLVIGFSLIGEGLNDILNPRISRR
ncbi:MAG: ABC transporter permease [Thaumarchaeota archaeon]|nr:ABC transporter permease [Candidatus Geocrenenecus arthurdayi]MCL7391278.1 ABC transporter permease [Candidatus Geocrenenecus arthurdayi]